MGSHLWAALALFPRALALSFILLLNRPANRRVRFNLLHPEADVPDRASAFCDSAPRNEAGAGFYSSNIRPPCLATSCPPLILCSLLTEPKPSVRTFLRHTLLKHTFVKPRNRTLTEYSIIQLSLCIRMRLTPTLVDLYYFYLRGPILFDRTKVTEESVKHWESSSRGVYALSTL